MRYYFKDGETEAQSLNLDLAKVPIISEDRGPGPRGSVLTHLLIETPVDKSLRVEVTSVRQAPHRATGNVGEGKGGPGFLYHPEETG